MAALVHAESRRMYSWWWDSHISPKNSKWLQENLSDMDEKIKQMIKLIEEDADSFARRAEMYYKKRPDLLNLVEQFYRAYRALAERYDHATGVLRQAHRSMAEAFPNQVPPDLDDSIFPASSSDHEHSLGDDKEFDSDFVGQFLRKELVKLEAENEASLLQYQQCLDKMSAMEKDTEHTRVEAQTLQEELLRVQEEKVDMMGQFEKSLKTISGLEKNLEDVERCLHDVTERFHGAEIEVDILKQATERMCEEKESASLECRQLLTKVAAVESLEEKVRVQSEELIEKNKEVGRLWSSIQEERLKSLEVENALQDLQNHHFQLQEEIRVLRGCNNDLQDRIKKADKENKKLTEMNSSSSSLIDSLRGETISLREIIRKLEKEVEVQVEEQNALHQEIYIFKEKMNMIKDKYLLVMEQVESVGLDPEGVRSYVNKLQDEKSKLREFCDRKLRENTTLLEENAQLKSNESVLKSEMEEVKKRLEDEISMLKESHDLKLEENSTLLERTAQMENVVSDLKLDLEKVEQRLQQEKSMLRELCDQKLVENATLLEKNALLENMVFGLKSETKELKQTLQDQKLKLRELGETTAAENADLLKLNTRMEDSISCSKLEFEKVKQMLQVEKTKFRESSDENARRSAELLQKNAVLENSVACLNKLLEEVTLKLEDERAKFKELVDENMRNNVALLENNALLENSVSYLTKLMEESINKNTKENMALIEKNCFLENSVSQLNQVLEDVKQKLTASEESQTSLICQLQVAAANSERHEKRSDDSQNSLSSANAELGRVRIMLKRSEESWLLLLNEKLGLITEKESLSFQLETTKRRLEESRQSCEDLERKCTCLSKEREEQSMNAELFKTRVDALESQVMLLQQEALSRNWEFREELDKALNNHFEIFILKNCVRDLEERNFLLSLESQKLVKACESSERNGVSIKKGMSQKVQEMHNSISELLSENFQHVVQKSVMVAVIGEMQQEMMKISKERDALYKDLKVQSNRYLLSQSSLREKDAEAGIIKQKLASDLLKKKEEAEHWEARATDFYREIMVSNFREALLEQKVEEVTRSKAEEREMLASRIRLLEEENAHLTSKLECQTAREAPLEDFAVRSEISTSLPMEHIQAHTEEIQVHYDHLPEVQIRANTEEIQVHYDHLSEHIRADSEGILVHYDHFPMEHLRANSTKIQDITLIPRLQSASPVVGAGQETERGIVPDNSSSSAKSEDGMRQNEAMRFKRHNSHRASDSKPRLASRRKEVMKHTNRPGKKSSQHPIHPESEVLTKDILLDQMSKCSSSRPTRRDTITGSDERMLELWETTDHSGSIDLRVGGVSRKAVHPSRESFSGKELGVDTQEPSEKSSTGSHRGGRYLRRILERLNGDAQKLTNMHITVQDLKKKAEVTERSGTGRTAEYRAVKEQLEEAEVAIVSFFDMNHRITKSAKRGYSSGSSNGELNNDEHGSTFRRRISEQARQGSEKIASLQQEIQKIQFFLLKLDDEVEKNSREDVRLVGTSERKTRVLLKDFLHVRVRPTLRRKKGQCCSCVQLPTRAK